MRDKDAVGIKFQNSERCCGSLFLGRSETPEAITMPKTFCVSIVLLGCGLAVAVGQSQTVGLTFSRGSFVSSFELSGRAVAQYCFDLHSCPYKVYTNHNGQSSE